MITTRKLLDSIKKLLRLSRPGFSLIEVMAVVFVISIGMVGMMTLVTQSIRAQRLNRHSLVAYQLAQEGIELVRVIRDSNWRDTDLEFTDLFADGGYCIDISNVSLMASSVPCPFRLENNFYIHTSGTPNTPYRRLVTIEFLHDEAVMVRSIIHWQDGNNNFTYNVSTLLYDWR